MESATAQPTAAPNRRLLLAAALGALVALSLGIYASVHDPSGEQVFTFFFSSQIAMKVYLGLAAVVFALLQVLGALWLYGKLPLGPAPAWVSPGHRISGRLAFLLSLPVAYHCLWSLGFQDTDTRVLAHSLLGCAVYGAFALKVTVVRSKGVAGWALPVAGGLMFAVLVGAWLTSGLWFVTEMAWPDP